MLSPLPNYKSPSYPTKEQIQLHPELLRTVPRRWARNPVVLTALSLVLSAGLTACGTASDSILPDSNSAPAAFLQKQYNDMYPVISYVEDTAKNDTPI